ncbi:MAG: hypothetical protein BWX81_01307 [Spirochaetes bacterium ADurb.Bin110]|nr:MAG: hypothetical protein BWX81_01307 [Spirochaetes bacterium ADurb.Bin110]HNV37505.1 DUF86 domain-containing protein [Rectinema sp.]
MQITIEDKAYLWDIVDACSDIMEFTKDRSFSEFANDKMCRFAVERQLLVIGEACKKLSRTAKAYFPSIEWPKIIGLRNIIAHEYGEILTERIWLIVQDQIPELYQQLKVYIE